MASPNPANISAALQAIGTALQSFSASLAALTQAGASGGLSPQAAAIISQVMSDLAKGIAGISAASATLGNAAANAGKANTAFASVNATFGLLANSAIKVQVGLSFFTHALEKAIQSLGQQFTRFVQLANPATVIRFNRAMENFQSAIGQILTPVLEKLTPIIQQFANAIASLDEPTKKLLGGLALGSALAGTLSAVAAAIAAIVSILGGWVTVLIALGAAVAGMVIMSEDGKKVMESFSGILKMFGTVLQTIAKPISALLLKIGEAVAPLLAVFEPLIEAIGELQGALIEVVIASLTPFLEMVKMLTPILAAVVKVFSGVIKIFSTLIQIVVKLSSEAMMRLVQIVAQFVEPAIRQLVDALSWMVNKLIEMANWLRRQFNLDEIKPFDPNAKQAQAVVKQASIGDVQSFLKRAYESSATGSSNQNIPKQQLDKLGQINDGIGRLAEGIAAAMGRNNKNGGWMGGFGDIAGGAMKPNIPQGGGAEPMRPDVGHVPNLPPPPLKVPNAGVGSGAFGIPFLLWDQWRKAFK